MLTNIWDFGGQFHLVQQPFFVYNWGEIEFFV